jgi:DNA-binding response OmpR family regulator
MNETRNLKVFIQEDDEPLKEKIAEDLKDQNYRIYFFSKDESVFDLIKLYPDIVIQDYNKKKVINLHEWAVPI